MENKPKILKIRTLPYEIKEEVKVDETIKSNLSLTTLVVLQHQKGNRAVGLHLMIRITSADIVLLSGGATFVAQLDNWETIEDNDEDIRKSQSVLNLVEYAVSFVSGMCYERTAGTTLNEIGLPYIPADELVGDMLIQKLG